MIFFPGSWVDGQKENWGYPLVLKYPSSLTAEKRLGLSVHGVAWCGVVILVFLGKSLSLFVAINSHLFSEVILPALICPSIPLPPPFLSMRWTYSLGSYSLGWVSYCLLSSIAQEVECESFHWLSPQTCKHSSPLSLQLIRISFQKNVQDSHVLSPVLAKTLFLQLRIVSLFWG